MAAERLLTVDLVEQAEAIYREVAARDPRNAIAVVGLARCALAREDDHEAHRLASLALRLDPYDDMARRMEARLSEVLALRGEPVERPAEALEGEGLPMRPLVAVAVEPPGPVPPDGPDPGHRRGLIDRLRGR